LVSNVLMDGQGTKQDYRDGWFAGSSASFSAISRSMDSR
jgi:hypothetical protein